MTAFDTFSAAHTAAESLHNSNVAASRATRSNAIRAAELAHNTAAVATADAAHKGTIAASAQVRNATIQAAWLTFRNSGSWPGYPGSPHMSPEAWP